MSCTGMAIEEGDRGGRSRKEIEESDQRERRSRSPEPLPVPGPTPLPGKGSGFTLGAIRGGCFLLDDGATPADDCCPERWS